MSENPKECSSQFPRATGDIFGLLGSFDQLSKKAKTTSFPLTENVEKQKINTFKLLEAAKCLAFLLHHHQNSCSSTNRLIDQLFQLQVGQQNNKNKSTDPMSLE